LRDSFDLPPFLSEQVSGLHNLGQPRDHLTCFIYFSTPSVITVVLICRETSRDVVNRRRHLWYATNRLRSLL